MDNQSVLASLRDHDQKKAKSKKSFASKTGWLMFLLFGVDIVAMILQIIVAFVNLNADLSALISVFAKDSYIPVHILM